MSDYYSREKTYHTDGTPNYKTEEDSKNEKEAIAALQYAWNCELREFGTMAAIDWYALRHGRMIGLIELKSRTHSSDKYTTVFLNVRKWLALTLGSAGLGCPSFFVVKFTDGIFWIPVGVIDATKHKIGGLKEIKKSVNDIEPIIEVPVTLMRRLKTEKTNEPTTTN